MRSIARVSIAAASAALAAFAATPALAAPGGGATVVRGQAFFVDGQAYRTVATPNTLPGRAPTQSFDVLYNFDGAQPAVADAAPGMPGYNGGRWIVNLVGYADGWQDYADGSAAGVPAFVSDEAVEEAIEAGALTIQYDVARFTCPVIAI